MKKKKTTREALIEEHEKLVKSIRNFDAIIENEVIERNKFIKLLREQVEQKQNRIAELKILIESSQ